ncbi:MAG TPA: hypothetical protein VK689_10190 [Armatimonadota bacterium]|nr:hypothetical protein [Armatimonadota bacterium]
MPLGLGAVSGSGIAAIQSLFVFFAQPSMRLGIDLLRRLLPRQRHPRLLLLPHRHPHAAFPLAASCTELARLRERDSEKVTRQPYPWWLPHDLSG